MLRAQHIAENLRDTQAAITQLERAFLRQTPPPGMLANLDSLRRRQESLEVQFAAATATEQIDVCNYRLFRGEIERDSPTLGAFTKTLFDFQSLFTLIFSAIQAEKPKQFSRVSAEDADSTAFGFAYSFTGSLGVALTLPNDRLLFGGTHIDEAIETIFKMAKSRTSDEIAEYAKSLGAAPIRCLYNWVSTQVSAGLNAHVEWKRDNKTKLELLIQLPELRLLKEIIESVSEEKEETIILTGLLVGFDAKTRNFHMTFESTDDIRGKTSEAIAKDTTVEIPKLYTAKLTKTTKVLYSTEKEVVTYLLENLG